MLKQMDKSSKTQKSNPDAQRNVLLKVFWDDFQQQEDGSWVTTREITIDGPGGTDRLIKAGREFKRGELSIVGIDLAALLDKHLTDVPDPTSRKLWNFKS